MLKIKNNVDLKELEKYGFKQNHYEWFLANIKGSNLCVKPFSKEIVICCYNTDIDGDLSVLYDLIKDGLVGKVEE